MSKRKQIFVDEAAGEELLLPVTPQSYQWTSGVSVSTLNLDAIGTVHLPGKRTLAAEPIECFFPAREYPFNEPGTVTDPNYYLDWLEKRCQSRTVLQYIVTDTGLNKAVIIESIRRYEDDGTNDVKARITIREYAAPGTASVTPEEITHTVQSGETLSTLCQRYYGTTSTLLCQRVASYNAIKNIYLLTPGQTIRFPPESKLPIVTGPVQDPAGETQVVEDPDGGSKLDAPPLPVHMSVEQAGYMDLRASVEVTYTPAGKSKRVKETLSRSYTRFSAHIEPGSYVRVAWTGADATSDYQTIDGEQFRRPILYCWPTAKTVIAIHWAKKGK